jgi:hypothetical protein
MGSYKVDEGTGIRKGIYSEEDVTFADLLMIGEKNEERRDDEFTPVVLALPGARWLVLSPQDRL